VFAGAGSGAGFRLAPGIAREAVDLLVAQWPDAPATAKPTLSTVSMD
ncbi:FAD-binding oxidoreductase, partial [Pseudomonas veronii]|nr:FAD-binding oxidoreductase [Pseudomonas veronii]